MRVQSAPPTLEEQVAAAGNSSLEPTPEASVSQFSNAPAPPLSGSSGPNSAQISAPVPAATRSFVPTGEAVPFVPQVPAYYGQGYPQQNYHVTTRGGYQTYQPSQQQYYPGYYHQAPFRPYIPYQGHQHPHSTLTGAPRDPASTSDAVLGKQEHSPSPLASFPAPVVPAPRQVKKIAIVDPSTGQELDISAIAKARPVESTLEIKHQSAEKASAPASTAAAGKTSTFEIPSFSRKPVVLVDPTSNKPVDISELSAVAKKETEKLEALLPEFDDEDAFSVASGFSSDDEEDHEEEEFPADIEFPVILTRAIKVAYPSGAAIFQYPPEGEPLRYSTEFMLQFAPHCQGSAQDIASIAFPKDIPVVRVVKKSARTGSSRNHRTSSSRQQFTAEQLTLRNRAQDAWKRACGDALPEELITLREVKQILNKLTDDKFDLLTTQILGLGILGSNVMSGVIDMLFEKAVEEPRYAPLYARLCHRIAIHEIEEKKRLLSPEEFAQAGNHSQFRKLLVTKCQHEYDAKRAYSSARLERIRNQEAAESGVAAVEQSKPQYSGELTEEDYVMIKTKRRVLGNMRFIGEIFIVGLIPAKIMHAVIQELLADVSNPEEEEVESVCRLIPTIGAALDIPESTALWEKYIERLRRLTVNTKLSTRVRFMVQDVLELREHKWSKVKIGPVATSHSQPQQRRNSERERERERDRDHRRDRRESGDSRFSGDVRVEHRPSPRSQNSPFERSGNPIRIQTRGKVEEIPRPSSTVSRASQESINRYQALEEDNVSSSPGNLVIPSISVTPSEVASVDILVDEKALSKLNGIFEEAQKQKNFVDCVAVMEELPPAFRYAAIRSVVLYAMDRGRKHVSSLVSDVIPLFLAVDGLLSSGGVISGLGEAFEMLDDLVVDIPSALEFAGLISAPFITVKLITISDLVENILSSVLERDSLPVAKSVLFALKGMAIDAASQKLLIEESRLSLEKCLFLADNKGSLESLIAKLELKEAVQL